MSKLQEITETVRDQWNEFAGGWKKWDEHIMRALRAQGDELIKGVSDKARDVLDVATGTGEPGLSVAQRFPDTRVTGADLSVGMLAVAQERAKQMGLANYSTRAVDGTSLPFDDGRFDVVLCRLGIMFFADPRGGVGEFRRVLRSGGHLGMSVWGEPAKNVWLSSAGRLVGEMLMLPPPDPEAPGVFRFAEPGVLAQLLEQSGFEKVEAREVTGTMEYESPREYLDMMLDVAAPIASALRKAPEAKQIEVKEALLATVEARAKPDGSVALPWSAWVVTAIAP